MAVLIDFVVMSSLKFRASGLDGFRGVASDWNLIIYRNPPVTGGQDTHTHLSCMIGSSCLRQLCL
jgi:hypothetical protein